MVAEPPTPDGPGLRQTHRHLLAGSAALVVGAAVQAVTGAVFWLLAARIDTTEDVGQATALFTSVLFIAYLSGLGLQVSLARFAPGRDHDSHAMFAWAVGATVVAATVVGTIYAVVVDTDAIRALRDASRLGGPALLVVGGVGAALTLIVDVRWMTLRRWRLVLVRITIVGLARFPLLLIDDGGRETVHLFAVAVTPMVVSGIVGVVAMPRVSGSRHTLFPRPSTASAAARYSAVNFLSTLAYQAPQFVVPVIVLLEVDPDANAAFYVAWGITSIAFYVPMALGQALLAEGGKDGAEIRSQVRVVLAATTALMAIATVAAVLGRDVVRIVYGDEYAAAARVLPLLVGAGVPWAVTSVFLTEARVRHRHVTTVAITATLTVAILVPSLVLVPRDGLDGAARAFLVGNITAAVVASIGHLLGRRAGDEAIPPGDPLGEELALHP